MLNPAPAPARARDDILRLVHRGLSVSAYTGQDHLKSIFAKSGAPGRAAIWSPDCSSTTTPNH